MAKIVYDKDGKIKETHYKSNDEAAWHYILSKDNTLTWGDVFGWKKSQKKQKWYNTGWVWVALVLFWPIGVYGLLLRKKQKRANSQT